MALNSIQENMEISNNFGTNDKVKIKIENKKKVKMYTLVVLFHIGTSYSLYTNNSS